MTTPFQISTHDQGDTTVNPRSTSTKAPHTETGIFALLRGPLRFKGSGARRLAFAASVALLALAFITATALAAAPEAPTVTVQSPVHATEAVLEGTLNPAVESETGTYRFLYKAGASCVGGSETPSGLALGAKPEVLPAETIKGLVANTKYTVCLLEEISPTEKTLSAPASFTTSTAVPKIITEEQPQLTSKTARFPVTVNPNGSATTLTVEYGPTIGYGSSTPSVEVPAGHTPEEAALVATIEADHTYHWRLIATNTAGSETGPDHTMVYDTTSGQLPDGRRYELVTPANKNGASVDAPLGASILAEVATNGQHLVLPVLQCFDESPSCIPVHGGRQGTFYEFSRTPSGWAAKSLAPPAAQFPEGSGQLEFNATAGTGLFTAPTNIPAAPTNGLTDEVFYGRQRDGAFSAFGLIGESPLSLSTPTRGQELATPTLSHMVYATEEPVWSFDPTESGVHTTLYEYEGFENAEPRLIAYAPGSSELASRCGSELGGVNTFVYNALAEDGETVYFTARPCGEGSNGAQPPVSAYTLYARYEHSRSELIGGPAPESAPEHGEACGAVCQAQPPAFSNFEGASSDGSKVFFTDPHQLTDGATEDNDPLVATERNFYCRETPGGSSGCNLYESECPEHCKSPADRRLVDVSAGDHPGEDPEVLAATAISSDGSHVYFVARGALTGANREGVGPVSGEPNLYGYERDAAFPDGHLAFIATLAPQDEERNWFTGSTSGVGVENVTPDGRFLVFLSHRKLTADNTREEGPLQVYRYDAATETLVRVSIGAKGFADDGNETVHNASIVPAVNGIESQISPLLPGPTMSDDGSYVFFESPDALVPGALNDVRASGEYFAENIYEYHEGEVSLITDGKDISKSIETKHPVELFGSDASGANVFFVTSQSLTAEDTNTERDVYDAHICSSTEPCLETPGAAEPCGEGACQAGSASPSGPGTPASTSFSGPGNLTPTSTMTVKSKSLTRAQKLANALRACKKDREKAKRKGCEVSAHKKYGPAKQKKAKKSTNDRRISR